MYWYTQRAQKLSLLKSHKIVAKLNFIKLKEFRTGIYSIAEARKEAIKILGELETGKDIAVIKGNGGKYIFKNLFNLYI